MRFPEGVISVVDDDESVRASTGNLLRSVGYRVETFAAAHDLLNSRALEETGCLLLDFRMPGIDGLQLQRRLHDGGFRIPIIFITAFDDRFLRQRAMECGAVNVLHKPFDAALLLEAVRIALHRSRSAHIPHAKLMEAAESCLTETAEVTRVLSARESEHLGECSECVDALANMVREMVRGRHEKKAQAMGSDE
ncbi:MAG TPA: response regulator [Terriglobia bacterium]|jgi:FixJ family two-component response regulator